MWEDTQARSLGGSQLRPGLQKATVRTDEVRRVVSVSTEQVSGQSLAVQGAMPCSLVDLLSPQPFFFTKGSPGPDGSVHRAKPPWLSLPALD